MSKRLQYLIVTFSSCLLGVLLAGLMLGRTNAAGTSYPHFSVLTEVVSKIKSEYVEEPEMKNVTLGALNGMLESIDPYASYLNAEQYRRYLAAREKPRAGIGVILARRFGYVGIVAVVPGSPAARQNLGTGDVLETIDGISTRDMPLAYAELLLQGDPGTSVESAVLRVRKGTDAEKMSFVREMVKVPPVAGKMLQADVAYIQVPAIAAGTSKAVAAKLAELERSGAKKLVLDLRYNAGGPVEEGIALADLFLDKGKITQLKGQKVTAQEFNADAAVSWKHPMTVLSNRGTSGGAEVAASALLDNKRATVVGERSYGEAGMRKALMLDDGGAVLLAVGKYFNADGKAIQDNGVTPSLAVPEPEPSADDPASAAPTEDLQLRKAVEVVTSGLEAAKKSGLKTNASGEAGGAVIGPLGVPRPR